MQVTAKTSQPLYPYPNHYHHHHHPTPVAPDRELKRQYLTLLPPQQIIEICLTFDVHVPPYVKASIWPIDINAAIAGLRKQSAAPSDGGEASSSAEADTGAIMDSLRVSPSEPSPASESEQPKASVEDTRPRDKEPSEETKSAEIPDSPSPASSTDVPAAPESTTSATTTAHTTAEAAPAASAAPTQPMPVAYPHQPYGYPYAPYYPPPPPGYPYPHHQYPAYPQPQQHAYPAPPPPAAVPPVPPPPPPLMQDGQSPDDLPSYEEMIVEALMDTNDPEGCAPKELFTWMAARYPVQSNFRPSASQALQKAYKRGRLEKSSNNKYRVNASWEGGNTSRRATRRPHTHSHTIAPSNPAPSSPFTNAPLVHHQHQQQQQQKQQHQPYAGHLYPSYPYPRSAYSNYSAPPSAPPQAQPATASTSAANAQDKGANDAYEAAQSILKAINFGSLLQLPAEDTREGVAARDPQAQGAYHQTVATAQPPTLLSALNGAQSIAAPVPATHTPTNSRADLQAHLVLLAAQLAELARVDNFQRPGTDTQGQSSVSAPVARPQEGQLFQQQQAPPQPPAAAHSDAYLQPQTQPLTGNSMPMASLSPPPPPPHVLPHKPRHQPQPEIEHVAPVIPPLTDEHLSSPRLAPTESMDFALDGEYDRNEDDDDMEEVI